MNHYWQRMQRDIDLLLEGGLKETAYVVCPSCHNTLRSRNHCTVCGTAGLRVDRIKRPDLLDQVVQGQTQLKNQALAGHSKFTQYVLNEFEWDVITEENFSFHKLRSYLTFYGSLLFLCVSSFSLNLLLGILLTIATGAILGYFYYRLEFTKIIRYMPVVFVLQLLISGAILLTTLGSTAFINPGLILLFLMVDGTILSSVLYSTREPEEEETVQKTVQFVSESSQSPSIHSTSSEFQYQQSAGSAVMNFILFLILYVPIGIVSLSVSDVITWEFGLTLFILLGVGVGLYLLPTFISGTNRKAVIFLFNVFLGWSIIGWVILLVLAVDGNSKERQRQELFYMMNKIADK